MESKQSNVVNVLSHLYGKFLALFGQVVSTHSPSQTQAISGYTYAAYGSLLALLIYRLCMIMQPHFSLFFDEAYYYHWSQALDFGYYSKPPVVAWMIALSTHLLQVSDFSVKFFSPVCYAIASFLVFQIARTMGGAKVGFIATIVFSTAPLVGFNSLFITTDAPLFLFWALSVYFMLRCEADDRLSDWICLGLCLGLGMLSKYTFALLPIGFIGYIVTTQQWRFLKTKGMWLAIGLGLAIAATTWWWNYQHGFVAFNHTHEIARIDGRLFNFKSLFEFTVTQLAIFGLAVSLVFLANVKKLFILEGFSKSLQLLLWITLPILLVIGLQSLLSRAFANWAGPYTIGASILVAFVFSKFKLRITLLAISFNCILLTSFYHLPTLYQWGGVKQTKSNSPFSRISGWQEISLAVSESLHDADIDTVISPSRELLAYMGFYANIKSSSLYFYNADRSNIRNHYDLKNNINELSDAKRIFLLISEQPISFSILARFDHYEFYGVESIQPMPGVERKVYMYRVSSFKGY